MATDIKAALDAATVKNGDKVAGILAVSPNGDLVRLPPGSVKLAASPEKGTYVDGLKPGWKLAGPSDLAAAAKRADEGEKKNPRGKASPKKAGA